MQQFLWQIWQAIGWSGCSAIATALGALAALFIAIDTWLKRRESPFLPPQTQQQPQIEQPRVPDSKESDEKRVS